jgi:hypothetical protein
VIPEEDPARGDDTSGPQDRCAAANEARVSWSDAMRCVLPSENRDEQTQSTRQINRKRTLGVIFNET